MIVRMVNDDSDGWWGWEPLIIMVENDGDDDG
mgnify:CR=1 FL=1